MISICLPNHANRITWLAMESLCRQITIHKWELIIYEDNDTYLGGRDFYMSYKPRLEEAGCVSIKYIYNKNRIPLSVKWKVMAQMSDKASLGMILQASDCYSEPLRINTAVKVFMEGHDWIQSPIGVFYHVKTHQTMLFRQHGKTGLNMAISMRCARNLPDAELWSGVDSWLFENLPRNARVFFDESTNWRGGIDTDGHNRISLKRRSYYNNPQPPFYQTDIQVHTLLPEDVYLRLTE